jgi:hypothetical protein
VKRISHLALGWLLALVPLFGGDIAQGQSRSGHGVRTSHGPVPVRSAADSPAAAAAVVRGYYAAIEARDFRRAYLCWGDGGASSRQTYDRFVAGFRNTAHVEAQIGAPGPIGAAAGSRYVEVPVIVRARTKGGRSQRFAGTYLMRRSEVDGATAAQRRWHIDSAKLRPTPAS